MSNHTQYYRCPKCGHVARHSWVMWEPTENGQTKPFCRRCYLEWMEKHIPVMEWDHSEKVARGE